MMQAWYRARTQASLGQALVGIREGAGLTQTEAAERAGASRPTISRLERGRATSTAVVLDLLAATGYEVILVPRGSRVAVTEAP